MNKNHRIIKIVGFRGLLLALFSICCLAVGFIVFPGWVFMHIWNYASANFVLMPKMALVHGCILWAIFALSYYAINGGKTLIGFSAPTTLNDKQIKEIMNRVKSSTGTSNPITTEPCEKEVSACEPVETIEEAGKQL